MLFHRVINSFMIQGGDPDSRNAKQGQMLGNGGTTTPFLLNLTVNLSIKGALAAARTADQVNPEKDRPVRNFT